jgi:hypothetical protein
MPVVTYKLVKSKDLSNPKTQGYQKKYPQTFSLPAIMRVYVQDDKTGDVKIRKVRYCPNETSIFYDEQDPAASYKKITIVNGVISVDTDLDPNLWKIMEITDLNGSKPNRNKKKPAIFERYEPELKHKAQLKKEQQKSKDLAKFFTITDDEAEAIAVAMGVKVIDTPVPTWKHKLYEAASKNSGLFAELVGSNLDASICANKAMKHGIVHVKNHKWYWDATELCDIPRSITERDALINLLSREPATLDALNVTIRQWEEKVSGQISAEKIAEKITAADALQSGVESKVLQYDKGIGWRFTEPYQNLGADREQYFGEGTNRNNKPGAIEFIAKRSDVKKEILVRINKASKGTN